MGDLVLTNVSSSCSGKNVTVETNLTTACASGRPRGNDEVPAAIDCVTWTLVIADGAILSVGLVGNMLVVYVVARYARMKTATNVYILNQVHRPRATTGPTNIAPTVTQ